MCRFVEVSMCGCADVCMYVNRNQLWGGLTAVWAMPKYTASFLGDLPLVFFQGQCLLMPWMPGLWTVKVKIEIAIRKGCKKILVERDNFLEFHNLKWETVTICHRWCYATIDETRLVQDWSAKVHPAYGLPGFQALILSLSQMLTLLLFENIQKNINKKYTNATVM